MTGLRAAGARRQDQGPARHADRRQAAALRARGDRVRLRQAGRHGAPPRPRPAGHPRRDPRLRRDAAAGARAPRAAAAARRRQRSGRAPGGLPISIRGWRPGRRIEPPTAGSTCWRSTSRPAGSCCRTASPTSGGARSRPAPGCGWSGPSTATCAAPARRGAPRRPRSAHDSGRRRPSGPRDRPRRRPSGPGSTGSGRGRSVHDLFTRRTQARNRNSPAYGHPGSEKTNGTGVR